MFALIVGSAAAFVAVLILAGAYAATRAEDGSDYFASDAVKLAAVIVVALLSVTPTDLLTIVWLTVLRDSVDATGHFFLYVVTPVVAAIVTVQALVLSRAYRPRPLLYGAVYLGVYAVADAVWLTRLFNPLEDVVRYAAVILIVGASVMALVTRFVWRRPA